MTELTVAGARDSLVDALTRWHVDGDPPYLSERVRLALRDLDEATRGAVSSVALSFMVEQQRRLRAENNRLRAETGARS